MDIDMELLKDLTKDLLFAKHRNKNVDVTYHFTYRCKSLLYIEVHDCQVQINIP